MTKSCCKSKQSLTTNTLAQLALPKTQSIPPKTFNLAKGITTRTPVDLLLLNGSIRLKDECFKDDGKGETTLQHNETHPIKIYRNWPFTVVTDAKFETLSSSEKTKIVNNLIENKFSFAIFALATAGSFVAFTINLDPILIFTAILMCICPCIFLQADAGISSAVQEYLKNKGLLYNGSNLMQTLDLAKNAELVCDINGTVLNNTFAKENESGNALRPGVSIIDNNLYVNNFKVRGLSGSSTCKANNITNDTSPSDKQEHIIGNTIYIGNGENDIEVCKHDKVVSIAVERACTSLKFVADFSSINSANELNNFVNLPAIARTAIRYRNILYTLAIIYSVVIIPLVLKGIVSAMHACIAMSIAGIVIMLAAKLIKYSFVQSKNLDDKEQISQRDAINALKKMAYLENNKLKSNFYSEKELQAQLQAALIITKKYSRAILPTLVISLLLALSFIKIIILQQILYYTVIPITMFCLIFALKEVNFFKVTIFVLSSSFMITSAFLFPKIKPQFAIISRAIAICLVIAMLCFLYKNGLNMYEVQLSAIILLSIANYTGLAHMHLHHILIMALVLLISSFVKNSVNSKSSNIVAFSSDLIADSEYFVQQINRQQFDYPPNNGRCCNCK